MNQSVTPYHHGDLRNCAIIAAAELIESIGSYDITIAQVAKRVGVSSPALYRHFKDKDALLTAVRSLPILASWNTPLTRKILSPLAPSLTLMRLDPRTCALPWTRKRFLA